MNCLHVVRHVPAVQAAAAAVGAIAGQSLPEVVGHDPLLLQPSACVGDLCAVMSETVTAAIAHMLIISLASSVTAHAQRTPIVAAAAAPVPTTQTASAAVVHLKTPSASSMKAGAAQTSCTYLTCADTGKCHPTVIYLNSASLPYIQF